MLAAVGTILSKPTARATPPGHKFLGYFILLAGIVQATLGVFFHDRDFKAVHRTLGKLTVALALVVQVPSGFAIIGYVAHIAHAFMRTELLPAGHANDQAAREVRIAYVLTEMGNVVLKGAFSTFLSRRCPARASTRPCSGPWPSATDS